MKHIDASHQPEAVKQFLLSLDLDADGSIIECDGRFIRVSQAEHDPNLIHSIQHAYDQRNTGRPLDEVAADIRAEFGFQQPQ